MTLQQFKTLLMQDGIVLTQTQEKQFQRYYELLLEWNEKMNLTAITDESSVYLKHFYDSLTLALKTPLLYQAITLCDVGAGAGFPSIPLKIVLPHLKVTIVDSLNKRIIFLNEVVKQLQLEDVQCFHNRAEIFGQDGQFREKFDIVTARAVAKLNLLSELCLPLVSLNGHFISMKAANSNEEMAQSTKAISLLGGKLQEDISFNLPDNAGNRHIIIVKKVKTTPKKYPRKPGIPAKNPI